MRKPPARPASGRLLLRLPASLHRAVQISADAAGISVNEYCVRRLATPGPSVAVAGPWVDLVTRAVELFGSRFVGLIAHGSWVRGDTTDGSDIDALVVVEPSVPLLRATYRAWDEKPLEWQGRPVDVHVVHLPVESSRLSALWYEAAVEGVVVYERDGAVAAQLRRARRVIASGRVVRKLVQGQPYWTDAA